ncbi:MAG TPA: dihydrodipicolinate synthase family protein [Candidatus Handelsmanbacteria bacterium]|nr:dihydrodipicolinate synthase family protein [Candidatus Handelsmanbacteria bacterium]
MPTKPLSFRGVVPILITPFDAADRIDEDGLRSVVDYNIDAGVHGLGIAYATEIPKLTEAERDRVTQIVVEQAGDRVPVVVNTGAPSTNATVLYSRQAEALGASAVMGTPPAGSSELIRTYFTAMSAAVRVPVFVQEVSGIVGGSLLRQMAQQSDNIRYAKIESAPTPKTIKDAVESCHGLVTVLGGASGTQLIEELRRGSQGTMPWPSLPHAFVQVWDLWEQGEQDAARQVWEQQIQPVLRINGVVHKQILYRQGVIADPRFRSPDATEPLDEDTQREFDEVCERLGIGR